MNILLIDQDPGFLDQVERLIQLSCNTLDLIFEKAQKPEDAAQMALQNRPDMVVIDPRFSQKWGRVLIKTVKDLRPGTCVILLYDGTILEDPDAWRALSQEFGADCHIDKKKDLMTLPGIVRDVHRAVCRYQPLP